MDSSLRPLLILSFLATQANPVSAARIAEAVDAPRSSTFRLLRGMQALGYVTHLPEEQSYALGIAAREIGQAFGLQAPLARYGRPVFLSVRVSSRAARANSSARRSMGLIGSGSFHPFDTANMATFFMSTSRSPVSSL